MLGSRIEEMLISEENQIQGQNYGNGASSNNFMPFIASNISIINDEAKQKQLLQEDEEEDFLDESKFVFIDTNHHWRCNLFYFKSIKVTEKINAEFLISASVNPNGSSCPIALKLVACVLLMEITTFLRETYKNLPKANKPIGSRFLEPRVSQMWGIGSSMEARPPTRGTGAMQADHGQNLLSATGNSSATTSAVANTGGGRRWSAIAQTVTPTNQMVGNPTSLAVTSQSSPFQPTQLMSPTGEPSPLTSAALAARGQTSTVTTTTSGIGTTEQRRISFVIQDDTESITSSQTTLAVQVSNIKLQILISVML